MFGKFVEKHNTLILLIIAVLAILGIVLSIVLAWSYESRINDLSDKVLVLNDQVKSYSSNLARLYEDNRYLDSNDIPKAIDGPQIDELRAMPNMMDTIEEAQPVVQPVQQGQQVQPVQPVAPPVQPVQPIQPVAQSVQPAQPTVSPSLEQSNSS